MPESAVLDAPTEIPAVTPPTENGSSVLPAAPTVPENPLDALKILAKPAEPTVVPTEPTPASVAVSTEPAVARFVTEEVPSPTPAVDAYQGPNAMDVLNNGRNGENKAVKFKLRSGDQGATTLGADGAVVSTGERMLALGTDSKDPNKLVMPEHTNPAIDTSPAENMITFLGKSEGLVNAATGEKIENGAVLQLGTESVRVVNYNPDTNEIVLQREKLYAPSLPQPEKPRRETFVERIRKSNTWKKLIPLIPAIPTLISVVGNPSPIDAPAMPEIYGPRPPAITQPGELKVPEVLQQTLDTHYPKEGDSFQGFVKHRLGKGIAELVAKVKANPNGDPEAARVVASLKPEIKQLAETIAEKENKNLRPVDPDDPDLQKLVQDFLGEPNGVPTFESMARGMERSITINNAPGAMTRKPDGDFSLRGGELKSDFSDTLFKQAAGGVMMHAGVTQGPPPAL